MAVAGKVQTAMAYQRAHGEVAVRVGEREGAPVLKRDYHAGSGKLRFPRRDDGLTEAMVLNTAGGLAGGDHFSLDVAVEGRQTLIVSTQASERVYKSDGGIAEVNQALTAVNGGRLIHMPQPTIVFDNGAMSRRTRIALSGDASLIFCETIVLGRAAMGETVKEVALRDRAEVVVDGRLSFVDALRLDGQTLASSSNPAVLAGHRGFGLFLFREKGSLDEAASRAREVLGPLGGASVVNGLMVARLLAPTHGALQDAAARLSTALSGVKPPRSWMI
ncbi:MAG: urease accessory protein UreD [Pseudomonadota bacterium]